MAWPSMRRFRLRNLRSERAAWQALGEHAESLRELRAGMPLDRSQTALQGR